MQGIFNSPWVLAWRVKSTPASFDDLTTSGRQACSKQLSDFADGRTIPSDVGRALSQLMQCAMLVEPLQVLQMRLAPLGHVQQRATRAAD